MHSTDNCPVLMWWVTYSIGRAAKADYKKLWRQKLCGVRLGDPSVPCGLIDRSMWELERLSLLPENKLVMTLHFNLAHEYLNPFLSIVSNWHPQRKDFNILIRVFFFFFFCFVLFFVVVFVLLFNIHGLDNVQLIIKTDFPSQHEIP